MHFNFTQHGRIDVRLCHPDHRLDPVLDGQVHAPVRAGLERDHHLRRVRGPPATFDRAVQRWPAGEAAAPGTGVDQLTVRRPSDAARYANRPAAGRRD